MSESWYAQPTLVDSLEDRVADGSRGRADPHETG